MRKYRVLLPVEIGGQIYQFGQVVELEVETAIEYAHALIAVEEPAVRLGGVDAGRETE